MGIPTDEELEASIPRDDELEAIIAAVVERKNAAAKDSAERLMAVRQLAGLSKRELGAPLIEELDPIYWGH